MELRLPVRLHTVTLPSNSTGCSVLCKPVILTTQLNGRGRSNVFTSSDHNKRVTTKPHLPLRAVPIVIESGGGLLSRLGGIRNGPLAFALSKICPRHCRNVAIRPFFHLCRYQCVIC